MAPSKPSPAITHFPSPFSPTSLALSKEEKINLIAERFKEIMEILGLDLSDTSLAKTPQRIAEMYVREIFRGIDEAAFPEISLFPNPSPSPHNNSMVTVKVDFVSFCEHHFVSMNGVVSVAYLPQGQLIGLSNIPAIVRYFAARPQLQERLTAQIADSLSLVLNIEDVAVSITAKHNCVSLRGIQDQNTSMTTNVLKGKFNTHEATRREFFASISS